MDVGEDKGAVSKCHRWHKTTKVKPLIFFKFLLHFTLKESSFNVGVIYANVFLVNTVWSLNVCIYAPHFVECGGFAGRRVGHTDSTQDSLQQTSLNLDVNHQAFHLLSEQYMVLITLHIQCKCNAFAAQRRRGYEGFTHCASLHFFWCVVVFLAIWCELHVIITLKSLMK